MAHFKQCVAFIERRLITLYFFALSTPHCYRHHDSQGIVSSCTDSSGIRISHRCIDCDRTISAPVLQDYSENLSSACNQQAEKKGKTALFSRLHTRPISRDRRNSTSRALAKLWYVLSAVRSRHDSG